MNENQDRNKNHYEKKYQNFPVRNILYWLNNLEGFLETSLSTEASWFSLYMFDFRKKLKGKKVLEMGCGDCVNAAVMAALGAEVYANDIASSSGEIIKKLNDQYKFDFPIRFIEGDFLRNNLDSKSFDIVVGKAFLHHLTLPLEKEFLKETARLLKMDGEARFFEPAVNNKLLDKLRWYIPVKNRPSKFQKQAYKIWKENDPHPDRSFSSKHFERAGQAFFREVSVIPVGTLERFSRFLNNTKYRNSYKKWSLKNEKYIPYTINKNLTKSQLLIYRKPVY